MIETLGSVLATDMVKNHHTSPPTSNSSPGGWKGGGGGESRPDHHLSVLPMDRNVDGNTHLSITVSETIPRHQSSSDVGSIGHSGPAATNGGESGSSVAHNVNLTTVNSGGNAAGSAGSLSLPSSGDSVAENVKAETAFKGFVSGLETNCNEQGQGGIGNMIDSGLSTGDPTYKRTNSAPPISDYMFNWPQSKLNSGSMSISDSAGGGMAGNKTGNDSSEVGCTTSESINTDYYGYDYGPQSIPHYSSVHGHSHSAITAQQLETGREMTHREIGHTVSYSSEPPLSALGGVAAGGGTGSVFATDPRGSPHVGLENLYRGGDQDMQGGGDELSSPIFADGHSGRHHPAERHRRATTLMPGAVLEYPLPYPPGNDPSPPGSQNFLTDIICPDFPSDGKEREAYVVGQGTVTKGIDSQGFPRPMQRQQSPPGSFGSHRDRALPHSNGHGILERIANDDSTGRPRYPSTSSSHKALNSEVYDETLVARRDSYGGPGNASGRGGGGAQQGQQEVMDLNSAFTGLAVSKPSKSHASMQKQRSFPSLPMVHQQPDYEAPSVGFKTSPYIDYNPSEYRAELGNHSQSSGRLDVEALMTGQADLKTAEPQVVQPANAYYVDPRGPGMYALDPHFQYRPVASQQYAEPPLYAQDVDHRRAMVQSPPALHLAYYPTDPRSTMSAPPRDPVYHQGPYSPSDGLRYEVRQGGGGARQKPFKERRDRDKEGRDRPRDKPRLGGPVSSAGTTGRPSLLESFLSNTNGKGRRWELSDIQGQVVQFCRDQHGSRFIQQKLEVSTVEGKEMFFEEILPHVPNLITDVFGNYVIQKLFDHGTLSQQENLAGFLIGHAVHLSLQMYGCRVVQKALMFASLDTLISLVKEFRGHVMRCVQDQNGNHVIQKCIEVVSRVAEEQGSHLREHIQFIIDAFANQVQKLSTHAYGCRVIQRILEHCVDAQRDSILAEIRVSFSRLIGDQYGNYVIQHVLKHGKPKDRNVLMEEVHKNLLTYSQHKFASNVVEKCLQFGTLKERAYIIDHVFTENAPGMRDGQKNLLQTMVCDPYANYVVQKMLDVATPEQHCAIIAEIKAHSTQLKRFTFGKYIISRLEKLPGNEEA